MIELERIKILDRLKEIIVPQMIELKEQSASFSILQNKTWNDLENLWDKADPDFKQINFLLDSFIKEKRNHLEVSNEMVQDGKKGIESRKAWKTLFSNLPDELKQIRINEIIRTHLDEQTLIPGIAVGLAASEQDGETFVIETYLVPSGSGRLSFSGFPAGPKMKECCEVALIYCRLKANEFQIDHQIFAQNDFHVHVSSSHSMCDGASAGAAFGVSMLSCLTGQPLGLTAFSGLLVPDGQIKRVGRAKEKALGAYEAGCSTLYIPKENESDLDDVKDMIENMEIVCINNMREISEREGWIE